MSVQFIHIWEHWLEAKGREEETKLCVLVCACVSLCVYVCGNVCAAPTKKQFGPHKHLSNISPRNEKLKLAELIKGKTNSEACRCFFVNVGMLAKRRNRPDNYTFRSHAPL